MDSWNAGKIATLLFEAGKIALSLKDAPHTEIKSDLTPVTVADKTIEAFLTAKLEDSAHGIYLIGEETIDARGGEYLAKALSPEAKTWIIDPIDGTANYASGHSMWGISIGFAENSVIAEGGVYIPEHGEMMLSDGEKVLYAKVINAQSAREFTDAFVSLKTPKIEFNASSVVNFSQYMVRNGLFRGPNPVIGIITCAYSGVTLALGKDAVYITGAKLWDFAGILPCLRRLGFHTAWRDTGECGLVSCGISKEFYNLPPFDEGNRPFALRTQCYFASTEEIIETTRKLCVFPG